MKFKKMIAKCKANNTLAIAYSDKTNMRYISDGYSCFYMPDFCEDLSAQSICSMYDISESKQDTMNFANLPLTDALIRDDYISESTAEPMDIRFIIDNEVLQPFKTEIGCVLIPQSYIDIVGKEFYNLEFTLREAIKAGMILEGVIGIKNRFSDCIINDF